MQKMKLMFMSLLFLFIPQLAYGQNQRAVQEQISGMSSITLWVFSILLVVSVCAIIVHYLGRYAAELLGYVLSLSLIIWWKPIITTLTPHLTHPFVIGEWIVVFGNLGLAASIYCSVASRTMDANNVIYTGWFVGVVWACMTIVFHSTLLGYLAVIILAVSTLEHILIALKTYSFLSVGAVLGGIILGIAVQLKFTSDSWSEPFLPGMFLVGIEGTFTALFLKTFHFFGDKEGPYDIDSMRIFYSGLFIVAIGLGSILGAYLEIPRLQEVFASYFTIWCYKTFFADIPWKGIGWAWAVAIGSLAVYPLALLVHAYPNSFNTLFILFK